MKKKASILAAASMTAVAALAISGCSGAGAGDGKEKLELWFWGAPPAQQETMQKVLVDGFNASQDDYELEVNFDNAVDKNIQVALSANRGPDVVYGSGPAFASAYAAEGKLADMSEYAEKYGWKDRILDSMYESGTYDGKLYSLPNSIEDIGVFYNTKVLDTLGVDVPTTYDEFVAILDKAADAGLYPSVTGNQGWKPVNQNYISLFLSQVAGGKAVYDALQGTIPWTDPSLVAAVQASADFYQDGYLAGDDYPNLTFDQSMKLLSQEKSPFFIGPSLAFQFASNYFNDDTGNTADLGFMAFPTINPDLPNPYYTLGTTASLSINAASKHQDGAAMVIDYMMSDEFTQQMNETWPGYWAVPLKDFDLEPDSFSGLSKPFVAAMQNTIEGVNEGNYGYFAGTFFPPATAAAFTDIDSVWLGNITAEKFMENVQKVFDEEQAKGLVPPLPEPAN